MVTSNDNKFSTSTVDAQIDESCLDNKKPIKFSILHSPLVNDGTVLLSNKIASTDPILMTDYGGLFYYYICDRDPTNTEPLIYTGYPNFLIFWWNQTTNDLFLNFDNTEGSLLWIKWTTALNIIDMLSSWKLNTPRAYSPITLTLGTARTPNATNDTSVCASIRMQTSLLTSTTLTVQLSNDGGITFTTIATLNQNLIELDATTPITFIVPANSQYKLVAATGLGTSDPTITSIYEVSL